MELYTVRAISNIPRFNPLSTRHARFQHFHSCRPVSTSNEIDFKFAGLRDYTSLSLRASSSDETSVSSYARDGPDGVITVEEPKPVEKEEYEEKVSYDASEESPSEEKSDEASVSSYAKDGPDGATTVEEPKTVEKEEYKDKVSYDAAEESPSEEKSDEASVSSYAKDGPDGVTNVEEPKLVEKEYKDKVSYNAAEESPSEEKPDEASASSDAKDGPDGVITVEEPKPVEKEEYKDKVSYDAPVESPSEENPDEVNISQLFESFLEKLDLEKIDADDKYSLLLLGVVGLTALYVATAVVRAIDSIPLVPKLLELVGLSYTVWFAARYLVLEQNRAEIAAKIKDIKERVLG